MKVTLLFYFLSIFIFLSHQAIAQLEFRNNTSSNIFVSIMYPENNEWIVARLVRG